MISPNNQHCKRLQSPCWRYATSALYFTDLKHPVFLCYNPFFGLTLLQTASSGITSSMMFLLQSPCRAYATSHKMALKHPASLSPCCNPLVGLTLLQTPA